MMLLSIGDQIRPGTYRFQSRFDRAVNFEHDGRLIAVVDESIGPGPLNIVLRGLKLAQSQSETEPVPSILKGLPHSAQGWIAGVQGRPEGVASRLPTDPLPPLRVSPTTILFAGHRCHFTARHRYHSTLDLAATMRLAETPLMRRSGNRTARSVWSAWSLLPLSNCPAPYDSASKLDALQTLRAAAHPQAPSQPANSLEFGSATLRHFHRNLSVLAESLKADASPKSLAFLLDTKRRQNFRPGFERAFAAQITRGVHQVFHGPLLPGIRQLKGCGLGLTPAGDDFIAGFLIGLHLLSKLHGQDSQSTADAVFRAARGKNIFSNTFLDLARRGLLFGHLKDLLLALSTGSETSVRKATSRLFAIGETSGADLATGVFLTLQSALCPR